MLNYISSFTVYFLEMLISYVFFSAIAEKRFIGLRFWIGGTVLFEVGAVINLLFSNTIWINILTFFIINVVYSWSFFKIELLKASLYSAILNVFSIALEFITIFIVSILFNVDIGNYNSNTSVLLIEGSISKVLYFIVCLILLNFIKDDKNNTKFPIGLYAYPISSIILLLAFWYICNEGKIGHKNQIILSIASTLLFGSTVILFISYQHNIEKENQVLILQSENSRLKTEKTYYDILEHQNQQLMIYAHDAKNHLTAIKGLNTNPEIDDYISKMISNLSDYSNVCHSGNMMLDVILNRYKTESKMKDICFSFDVKLSNLSYIENFDLVTILNNLLDNAFEAAEKSSERKVSIETDRRNHYEVIIITNSCDQEPIIKENHLITTKKEKTIHGLGLKSVSEALKKYDGDFDWEYSKDKKQFISTVMIKQPTT